MMETETKAYKTILEEQKLKLEILELEKKWYKKPTFFVPTIASLSSIFILWVTGFFNTKIESLNNSIDKLKRVKTELSSDSSKLAKEKNTLQLQINNLQSSLNSAAKPVLEIKLHRVYGENDFGIYISNTGSGIAYFEQINFYYKNELIVPDADKHNIFENLTSAIKINPNWVRWEEKKANKNIELSESLAAGQSFAIIKISKNNLEPEKIKQFLAAMKGLKVEIKYQSFSKKSFKAQREF